MSSAFSISGWISSNPDALPPRSYGPLGQPGPKGLLLKHDGFPQPCCPPPGSRVAATTGNDDLPTTAPSCRIHNRGFEHGQLGFHVPDLPRDVSGRCPRQDPPPDVPSSPSLHSRACQVFLVGSPAISSNGELFSSLHSTAQDIRPQIR